MNQQDRAYLNAIVGQLVDIQQQAPTVSIYNQGRTQGSVNAQLGDAIDALADWLDEAEDPQDE